MKTSRHRPLTEEMKSDLSQMGDQEFMAKWETSRQYPIRARKKLGILSFNNQHGTYPHEFRDGKEYKWCGEGHWELIENFGVHSSRYDGLRGHCKIHSNESSKRSQTKRHKTPQGKAAVRHQNVRRKSGYILWEHCDEIRAFEVYGNRCAYCGDSISFKTVEFDHFIPISKGGQTIPSNMIPSCVTCNRGVKGKKAKDPYTWLVQRFGDMGRMIYQYIREKQSIIDEETADRVARSLIN